MTHAIGTKVKVTEAIGGLNVGDVTTITGHGSLYPYRLADPSRYGGALVHDHEFEVVEAEPKFKAGDKVRLKTGVGRPFEGVVADTSLDWLTVRVTKRPEGAPFNHDTVTRFPSDGGYMGFIEKIEKSPQEFKLKKGDRVKNLKTGREGKVYGGWGPDYPNPDMRGDYVRGKCAPDFKTTVPAAALEAWEAEHPGTYDIVVEDKEPW